MNLDKLKNIILELEISPEVKKKVEEILATCGSGDVPKEKLKSIGDLLELEADLAAIKAGLFDDLAEVATQFVGNAADLMLPDLSNILRESRNAVEEKLQGFENRMQARLNAFGQQKLID